MESTRNKDMPSVAVVGTGYWGKNLVRNFNQIGALKMICDKDEAVLSTLQAQHPGVEIAYALTDVLKRDDIQGVVIATPAETHFLLAREALLAGKHVYVEKPLVLNESEGRELIEIAEKRDRVLMVGHLLQYHPAFVKLKELASSGDLGRINYVYSHRLNLGKIRREENILWSFAPHDISMILSLAGDDPESIQTTGGYYLHQRIADVTTTHLDFPSGLKAHIFVSWLHPFKEQKLVVVGDRKMVVFDDTLDWPDKLLIFPHRIEWHNNMPVPVKANPERVDYPREEPLKQECLHFIDCIVKGEGPATDGNEGLRVLRVLNASQLSMDQQGKRIRLNGSTVATDTKPTQKPPAVASGAFVHETAIVDPGAVVGAGTKIWHFSHVLSGSTVGERCNIGQNVVIGPDVTIGSNCKIQNNVSVYKGVTLEDGVFCGPSMVFTNIYNPRAEIPKMDQVRPTLAKRGATIGANATIVCGTTLGRNCFVGAGAVVTRNVPDHALVLGNPAKQIGWMCICGERLSDDFECLVCGNAYERGSEGLYVRKGSNGQPEAGFHGKGWNASTGKV
jgi:UDP-2-acetamido-3-amino-2,3-dideoxy-glucuronate N-acetyltransferase